jgi:hypothetical protein
MKKRGPLIMGFEKNGDAVLPWNNEGVPTWGLFRVMHAAQSSIQRDHDLQNGSQQTSQRTFIRRIEFHGQTCV